VAVLFTFWYKKYVCCQQQNVVGLGDILVRMWRKELFVEIRKFLFGICEIMSLAAMRGQRGDISAHRWLTPFLLIVVNRLR